MTPAPLTCPDCQKPLKPKKAWGGELACFCRWKGRVPSLAQLEAVADTDPNPTRIKPTQTIGRWTEPDIPKPKPVEALTVDELSVELMDTIRAGRAGFPYDRTRLRELAERFATFTRNPPAT